MDNQILLTDIEASNLLVFVPFDWTYTLVVMTIVWNVEMKYAINIDAIKLLKEHI